jgi:hypothetical protein
VKRQRCGALGGNGRTQAYEKGSDRVSKEPK